MANGKQTAVLYDPSPLFLEALEQLLSRMGVDVLAKTTSTKRAVAILADRQPTLFVGEVECLDGNEGPDGIDLLREAKRRLPSLKMVVLSAHADPERIEAAFDAGAAAFVLKSAYPEDVASAIRQAFKHSVYYPGSVPTSGQAKRTDSQDLRGLTPRELEILRLVSEGYSNQELAKMLWVTEQTVKFHLSNTYRKLNVSNRTEAARWAQLHGVLPQGRPPTPGGQASVHTLNKSAWLSRAS